MTHTINTEYLMNLYTYTQDELVSFILDTLYDTNDYDVSYHDGAGIIATPKRHLNNTPVVLVAHMDTINTHRGVEPTMEDMEVVGDIIQLKEGANPKVACLGADDRNGVYALLDLIGVVPPQRGATPPTDPLGAPTSPLGKRGKFPTLVFPFDEEIGCIGSTELARNMKNDKGLKWLVKGYGLQQPNKAMIQIDRGVHGSVEYQDEIVFYTERNAEFIDFITNYWVMAEGSYTDVVELVEPVDIAIANVAAGYMNEHTRQEICVLEGLDVTIDSLHMICNKLTSYNVDVYHHESVECYDEYFEIDSSYYDDYEEFRPY